MNRLVQKAFTLIELLVVIAVIGILSGLIVVSMSGVTNKATIAKGQIFNNSLRSSLMLNLIAEYKLDGNASDSWSNHTTGTISEAASYSSCVQGSCYSFDGSNDYIELPDSPDIRMVTGGTISAWIYPKSLGESSAARIIDKSINMWGGSGYAFSLGPDNKFYFTVDQTDVTGNYTWSSNNAIKLNQWSLATASFNLSGRKLYINGIELTDTGGSVGIIPPNTVGVVTIGNRTNNTDRTFDGYIDEIRFYNTAIPAYQIREQYYSGLNNLLANKQIDMNEYINNIKSIAKK